MLATAKWVTVEDLCWLSHINGNEYKQKRSTRNSPSVHIQCMEKIHPETHRQFCIFYHFRVVGIDDAFEYVETYVTFTYISDKYLTIPGC